MEAQLAQKWENHPSAKHGLRYHYACSIDPTGKHDYRACIMYQDDGHWFVHVPAELEYQEPISIILQTREAITAVLKNLGIPTDNLPIE